MSNTPTHGSDVQETPDWWKASDGRFYPPELHPDYVKSAEPDPAVSAAVAPKSSLADRLRAEADRVGDEASAAADAGVGSLGGTPETMSDAKSTIDGAPASAAAATSGGVADGMPLTPDSIDPRATIAQGLPAASGGATVIQRPGIPPSPGAPPTSPPSMPPMPSAPSGMPPAPGAPPSAMPEQGPGGITYTAVSPPLNFQTPVAPAAPAGHVAFADRLAGANPNQLRAARRGAARRGAGRRGATRHDTTRQRPTAGGRRRQRQRRSGWTAGQRRTVAAACGLWDVGRMWFLFVLLKKAGFCTIEARILGQDRLTYCAAFSNLGVGVSTIMEPLKIDPVPVGTSQTQTHKPSRGCVACF